MTFSSSLSPELLNNYDLSTPGNTLKTETGVISAPLEAQDINKKVTRAPERKQRERYYKRQKVEKELLTEEITRLSSELVEIRAANKLRKQTEMPVKMSVWEPVARHRLEALLAAEAKRQWLQTAIAGKTALTDDLLRVVRQHVKIAKVMATQFPGYKDSMFLEPPTDLLYAMDVQDINDLYNQTDAVFSASGLDPNSVETTRFQRSVIRSCDGVSIQNVRRQYMVFSYEETCQSIWMLSHLMHWQEDREDYVGINDPENTIATKFRITRRFPGGSRVSLNERFVLRQFKEDKRTVLVWKAFSSGESSWLGKQTEETGWAVIRPSSTAPGTVMELCLRLVPWHLKNVLELPANPFDDLLQAVVQEDTEGVSHGAKELLLEHVLTGIHA